MKLALFGASGMIGSRILREALSRGHQVTAIVRDGSAPGELPANVATAQGDILDPSSVATTVKGNDVVLSAYGPGVDDKEGKLVKATRALIQGVSKAGVKRIVVVGGAATLEVAPGVQLIDSGKLPEAWKSIALAHRDAKAIFEQEATQLDWSYLSPAAFIEPGVRTGKFRLGGDQLLVDAKGESRISAEDFAIAFLDETEQPRHVRKRFTVAY